MKKVSTFADRLKSYRDENDMTLKDLEKITEVPAQTLNRYELGQRIPKVDKAGEIADLIGVNSLWLQGYDVPITSSTISSQNIIEFDSEYLRRIPLVGRAAAGDPMMAIEHPGEYIVIDTRINKINGNSIDEFYALEVIGQSMEPTIYDGEIVLVRRQPIIELGEIGVFRCNHDETTIKRFAREGGKIYLVPDNKQFPVLEYSHECVCIGKVMESIRRAIK